MTVVENAMAMREALTPFADEANRWDDVPGVVRYEDDLELWQTRQTPINVGHLRRARVALAATEPKGDAK